MIAENGVHFKQLSLWDQDLLAENAALQRRCAQQELLLKHILALAVDSTYRGKPSPLGQEILRVAERAKQGAVAS